MVDTPAPSLPAPLLPAPLLPAPAQPALGPPRILPPRVTPLAVLLATAACALAGCGHRGPLYLPGKPGDPAFDRQNRGAVVRVPAPATNRLPPANDRSNADEDGNW